VGDVAESGGNDAATFSIDELALAAGLPTRTVRHYQSAGALPPPRRQGRVAVYDATHLERLRLIGRLQDRGLRLDAIRDALKQVERGHLSLEAWLGLGEQVRTAWSPDRPALMLEDHLQQEFGELQPGVLAALLGADLVRRPENAAPGTYLVPSPALLQVVLALSEAGIDIETAAGALELLRKQERRAADELVNHLVRRAGKGFAASGSPEDVATAVAALRSRVVEAVEVLFAQEMERALRVEFEHRAPRFVRPGEKT
jgi:DNA-binding transcriptional MerR regulator